MPEGLRARQKHLAREAILEAVAQHVAERGLLDFSVPEIARLAGVSHRTVYNYFPNRDALVDEFSAWANQSMNEVAGVTFPDTLDGLPDAARRFFPVFSRMSGIATAFARVDASPAGSKPADYQERRLEFRRLVADALPDAGDDVVDAVTGLIAVLATSHTWYRMTTDHGLDGDQAGVAVAWLMSLMIEAVASGDVPQVPARTDDRPTNLAPERGGRQPREAAAGRNDDGRREAG